MAPKVFLPSELRNALVVTSHTLRSIILTVTPVANQIDDKLFDCTTNELKFVITTGVSYSEIGSFTPVTIPIFCHVKTLLPMTEMTQETTLIPA